MQAGLLLVRRPDHDSGHEHDDLEDDVDEDDHDPGHNHDYHEDDDVDRDVEPEWSACPGIILSFLGNFPLLSNRLSSLQVRCHSWKHL